MLIFTIYFEIIIFSLCLFFLFLMGRYAMLAFEKREFVGGLTSFIRGSVFVDF